VRVGDISSEFHFGFSSFRFQDSGKPLETRNLKLET
jgi:hypothetical protein